MTELKEITKNNNNNNSHLPVILLLGGIGIILSGLGFFMKTLGGIFTGIGIYIGVSGIIILFVTVVSVYGFYAPQYIRYGTIRDGTSTTPKIDTTNTEELK